MECVGNSGVQSVDIERNIRNEQMAGMCDNSVECLCVAFLYGVDWLYAGLLYGEYEKYQEGNRDWICRPFE